MNFFSFMINPGDTLQLNLSWTLEGSDYEGGSSSANFSQFLSIDSATSRSTPPQEVPEPATLLLLAFGILAFGRKNILSRNK